MSWLFGAVHGSLSDQLTNRFRSIHASPKHTFVSPQIYVAAGGIDETCHCGRFPTSESQSHSGWALVGTGIRLVGDRCAFLSSTDWGAILMQPSPDLSSLDGHFCIVRWNDDTFEVWTDEIGLRTLYVAPLEGGYCFSTRLHWLAQATGFSDVSFEELGANWLLANKMRYGCLVKGVTRVSPGGYATITARSFTWRTKSWLPQIADDEHSPLIHTLNGFSRPHIAEDKVLSLGLSGGFDSRLLLSQLSVTSPSPFVLHTFGADENPDVAIAKRIAHDFKIHIDQYNEPLPPLDDCVFLMKQYVAQTCLIAPVSSLLKLRYYRSMHENKRLLIDGAYGEILRRQLGNSLIRKGKGVHRNCNPEAIFSMKELFRASIFLPDVEEIMRTSAMQEIAEVWQGMPSVDSIGIENFIDLVTIRTLAANSCPAPQDWIDSQILNYMPYTQPTLLRDVFRTPLRERRNARLARRVLADSCAALRNYPLAKEGTTYPYPFTTIPAWAWRKGKETLGMKFDEQYAKQLLLHTREFVQDMVRSAETKSFGAYDYPKVARTVEDFYRGSHQLASQVDWWLTFELWRRSLSLAIQIPALSDARK